MNAGPAARASDLADGVLLVEYPAASEEEANRSAVNLAAALSGGSFAGIRDAIPGARTLCVLFDSRTTSSEVLRRAILSGPSSERLAVSRRSLSVPVVYGGAAGPDLAELSSAAGLSSEDFARRHADASYDVAFLGFAPGFAYLAGLPSELHANRLATPRARVPEGSVAIGGPYTGIYPSATPGGWRLIGRSPALLFEEDAEPPAFFRAGDRVRFEPIGDAEFDSRRRELAAAAGRADTAPSGLPVFRVVRPGLFTSVQGAPRHGHGAHGLPPGGAMDAAALARGNARLGNSSGAGALEITLLGPELEVIRAIGVCLTGADADLERNGAPAPKGEPLRCAEGDRLRIGRVRGGVRAYLCAEGGLAPPGRLGLTRRLEAGALVVGDVGSPGSRDSGKDAVTPPESGISGDLLVRVVWDPRRAQFFEDASVDSFLESVYRVSSTSDRRGIRLEGPPLRPRASSEIPPEGTALGTIQVPRDGLPIALGPDRPITGGYSKLGTLLAADWERLVQAEPGRTIRFAAGTLEAAE